MSPLTIIGMLGKFIFWKRIYPVLRQNKSMYCLARDAKFSNLCDYVSFILNVAISKKTEIQ